MYVFNCKIDMPINLSFNRIIIPLPGINFFDQFHDLGNRELGTDDHSAWIGEFGRRVGREIYAGGPGVLPYSLGGDVPLGLRKSYPLPVRVNFANFVTLYQSKNTQLFLISIF